jgi:integrase
VVAAYERAVAEWLAAGRRADPDAGRSTNPAGPSVGELILSFWGHAERHYRRPDGSPSSELNNFRLSFRPLRKLYEALPAAEFSPLKLKAVRQSMIDAGLNRRVINHRVGRIVRMFKWAVSEELVPVTTYQALKAVPGLQKGRTTAPEPKPVEPVPGGHVEAVLPHVLPEVAAMVRVQRLGGMRPGEVCRLRPCDVDRSGPVWFYRPPTHKTAYRGKPRVIALGPKAQAVLGPWLDQPGLATDGYVFSPRRAMEALRTRQRAARKSKVQPSQVCRMRKKPKRLPGEKYTKESYARAVAKGCKRAGVPHWHPHQLRHAAGTEARERYGLEAAGAFLGHDKMSATEVYAERNLSLAAKVARELG